MAGSALSNVTAALKELATAPTMGLPRIATWGVDSNVVDFDGTLRGGVAARLETLDVCPTDGAIEGTFVSSEFLRNVSAYNPVELNYYKDYVLPRVLPWAAAFFGVAFVFLLSFILWRAIISSVRCCCPTSGACNSCKPSAAPFEVLKGCWHRSLQCIITLLLLCVMACCVWGCFTAGPQVVSQTWETVDAVVAYVQRVRALGGSLVDLGKALITDTNALLDFLRANFGPSFFDTLSQCLIGQGQQLTELARTAAGYLAEVAVALAEVVAAAGAATAGLGRITGGFLTTLTSATGAGASITQLRGDMVQQARASLAAYAAVPSNFSAPDLQPVIAANTNLDLGGKIQELDSIVLQLQGLQSALANGTLSTSIGESQRLLSALQSLSQQVSGFTPMVEPLQELLQGLARCADDSLENIQEINATIIRLPPEASAALTNLDLSALSSSALSDASATAAQLRTTLDALVGPPYTDALSTLQGAQTSLQGISAAEIAALTTYIEGGDGNGGMKGALQEAQQPVDASSAAAQAFTAAPTPELANQYNGTVAAAVGALTALESQLESSLQLPQEVLDKLDAASAALQALGLPTLEASIQSLQQQIQNSLPDLRDAAGTVNATLREAREVAAANFETGMRDAVSFLESLNSTIYSLDATVRGVQETYLSPEALAGVENTLQDLEDAVEEQYAEVQQYRELTITLDDTRVYVSYALFALAIFSSLMIIIGVWVVVPFMYSFFTFVLLVCLLFFFILFIPYGAVTTVGTDSCVLVEEKVSLAIRNMDSLTPDQRMVMVNLWEYWTLGRTLSNVTQAISEVVGFDVDQMLRTVESVTSEVQKQLVAAGLRPPAQRLVDRISTTVADTLDIIKTGIATVEARVLSPIYVAVKGTFCCTVIGTAGYQWLAMLLAGSFIVGAAVFIFLFMGRIDKLPNKSVPCACCGCYRHRSSDKVDFSQFIMTGAQRQEFDNMYGPAEDDPAYPRNHMDMTRV